MSEKTNVLPLFLENHIEFASDLFDEKFDFKELIEKAWIGAGVEAIDGKIAKWTFDLVNNIASPYVPDEYKENIHAALNDVIDGDKDYTKAADNAFQILDILLIKVDAGEVLNGIILAAVSLIKTVVNIWLEKVAES